ncbi:MAG TPA: hypothetical protein VD846_07595 [Allosphingosinicella sp.]|nr:hypothetical protein [Allosphingosinicella sp.]
MTEPTPFKPAADAELFIRLDVAGLAALLRAVEAAMIDGRGHLTLGGGSGMIVSGTAPSGRFGTVTVTFTDAEGPADDAGSTGRPDPEPLPRMPILELQG